MSNTVFGFTFARGGSKGVPGKNIKLLNGVPLIGHAIRHALDSTTVSRHFVSTDDEQIAEVARQYGAEVPFMRPDYLSSDTASEFDAWKHAIEWVQEELGEFDAFVSVPTTSPLREPGHIDACVRKLLDGNADLVFTVCPTNHNPFFNMVSLDESGRAKIMNASTVTRRQDAPLAYNITTIAYAARPGFVLEASSIWDGRVEATVADPIHAIDIDTPLDFEIAEYLISRHGS